MEEKTIDVIIPTYKPGKEFQELLKRLMKQKKAFNKIFLLQTIEDGEKPMESNDPKIEVYPIAKKDFDHGHTSIWCVAFESRLCDVYDTGCDAC